jgi:hypothetical protein
VASDRTQRLVDQHRERRLVALLSDQRTPSTQRLEQLDVVLPVLRGQRTGRTLPSRDISLVMEVVRVTLNMEQQLILKRARQLRSRRAVDRLDYLRAVRALSATIRQEDLARGLGVTQPAISSTVKKAREVEEVLAGFSGASPYEIAERYSAGQIDRAQLVVELGRFPYAPTPRTDGADWLTAQTAKTVGEVLDALHDGLIDPPLYEQIQDSIDEYRQTALRE